MDEHAPRAAPTVVETGAASDLDLITSPHVQAVVYVPARLPEWMSELAEAVTAGEFEVPRAILDDVGPDEVESAVWHAVAAGRGRDDLRRALVDDVVSLVERVRAATGAASFTIRIFTGEPSTRCGYHVDTVPPRSATIGLLRVYNGAGTPYLDPGALTGMRDFYKYLSRRERLVRDLSEARDRTRAEAIGAELDRLDAELPFVSGRTPRVAPSGSVVMFEHLDASHHWSDAGSEQPWIHCSPMEGGPRLVVNVSPRPGRPQRPRARATRVTSR